jgi:hypothetical protein
MVGEQHFHLFIEQNLRSHITKLMLRTVERFDSDSEKRVKLGSIWDSGRMSDGNVPEIDSDLYSEVRGRF